MSPQKILFLTNSEYGQANVVLAVAHSLIHLSADIEYHIASFKALEKPIIAASDYAVQTAAFPSTARPLIFHELCAPPYSRLPIVNETNDLTPGLFNSARAVLAVDSIMLPWEPEQFGKVCKEIMRVLSQVNPDLSVIDPLFAPGLSVCNQLGTKWIVLAPNTIKDFAVPVQPGLAALWKYPLVCSALPFPLPWSKIPLNIALTLVAGYMIFTSKRVKDTKKYLRTHFGPEMQLMTANELGVLKPPPEGVTILTSSSPEIDYPFAVLPKYVIPCGPIIRAVKPIEEVDPDLLSWLRRGPTVYINLGTYLEATAEEAATLAKALKDLLDQADKNNYGGNKRLQIIWKLLRKGSDGKRLHSTDWMGPWKQIRDIIGSELDEDRVRITNWLIAEPKSILESHLIVCSVNHGGASSFNESLCAGVPQVILPAWADCYDFGNRVELLGIGRWANKSAKPRWERKELATALVEVILGPQAQEIKAKATTLSQRFPEASGRDGAAKEILAALNQP